MVGDVNSALQAVPNAGLRCSTVSVSIATSRSRRSRSRPCCTTRWGLALPRACVSCRPRRIRLSAPRPYSARLWPYESSDRSVALGLAAPTIRPRARPLSSEKHRSPRACCSVRAPQVHRGSAGAATGERLLRRQLPLRDGCRRSGHPAPVDASGRNPRQQRGFDLEARLRRSRWLELPRHQGGERARSLPAAGSARRPGSSGCDERSPRPTTYTTPDGSST